MFLWHHTIVVSVVGVSVLGGQWANIKTSRRYRTWTIVTTDFVGCQAWLLR